jgi:beta-xylosidase
LSNNWSDPVFFDFYAFDPSVFFDDDGKAYVHGAAMPGPETKIDIFEMDLDTGRKLGEKRTIWTGISKFFPEGPHIYKKDGWYYCLIAEDGTHEFHAVKIARSKQLFGPYESYENNPILTATGTHKYYQHIGHADLFQDAKGDWWCVCLGVRKRDGRFVLGRETFLTQAEWPEGEWPIIQDVAADPSRLADAPRARIESAAADEMLFIRQPSLEGYKLDDTKISLMPSPYDFTYVDGVAPISFAGKRQRVLQGIASATLKIPATNAGSNIKTGLGYFKDEHRYMQLYLDHSEAKIHFTAHNDSQQYDDTSSHPLDAKGDIAFRCIYSEEAYTFSYKVVSSSSWTDVGTVDTLKMSDFGMCHEPILLSLPSRKSCVES